MTITLSRRDFLKTSAGISTMAGVSSLGMAYPAAADPLYKISLAEWSINQPLFGGQMQHLDFAKIAKSVGIDAIEYVNQFFKDKAKDTAYLREMNTRAKGEGRHAGADHVRRRGQPRRSGRRRSARRRSRTTTSGSRRRRRSAATRSASTATAAARPTSR